MRVLSAAGNAAFLGVLGAGAFFGYYTVRYNAEELQTVVQETHKPENQFVGSSVRTRVQSLQGISTCTHGHMSSYLLMLCRFGFLSWSGTWKTVCT